MGSFIYWIRLASVFERKVGLGIYEADICKKVKVGDGQVSKVLASGQPNVWTTIVFGKTASKTLLYSPIRSALQVPLKAGSKVIGSLGLSFTDDERKFGEEEIEILSRFSELASMALG